MVDRDITVAIAGASGYTGGELTRLLLDHPRVHVAFVSAERHAGEPIGAVHPWLRNHPVAAALKLRPLEELEDVDVTFACLPTGALPSRMSLLTQRSDRVLNIAGDFRLRDLEEVRTHYPATASDPALEPFQYYIPELSERLPEGRFINLPGCMAVATLYALYPLFADSLVDPQVVADAKTGSSGAGRDSGDNPSERAGNFRVHRLHGHRHEPEVCQALSELTDNAPELQFSTYSLDVPRGIMVTAYARLHPEVAALDVKRAFARAYVRKPFVRVRTAARTPQDYPMLKAVVGSNVAEVAVAVRDDRCVAVSALDNLIKGAAGQAIQTMNLACGLDETLGLPFTAVSP